MYRTSRIGALGLGLASCLGFAASPGSAQDTGPDALMETYGDWTVRCATDQSLEEPQRVCFMQQQLAARGNDGQQRSVLTVFLALDQQTGTPLMTAVTPFGVDLAAGVDIAIDETIIELGYETCRPRGCFIREELPDDVIAAMRAGDEATFVIQFVGGQTVNAAVSLAGFSAGWQRLGEF
ncbi:hypothetical protein HKCCSP123_05385 [Rhodobacterales bacterium HKCCSP123]|nr:hypothetical protein [Rhodobacterales bacterium HKCCSP123]